MRAAFLPGVMVLAVLPSAGCGGSETAPSSPARTLDEQRPATPSRPDAAREALAAVRRFTQAANRGDLGAVLAATDRDIRFDSVGRPFGGEAGIRQSVGGEVIALGGRYRELSARTEGERAIVEYDSRTRGGGRERFTYACRARQARLTECVGGYV